MAKINWNSEQKKIIDHQKGNILISASAGSGKTAVMLERAVNLIKNGVPVERIMILAFNNDIAGEIRGKLYRKLLEEINNASEDKALYLCEQLDNINRANIITNDSYCNKCVNEFFHILNIDPETDILGEADQKRLFKESFENVLDSYKRNCEWIFEILMKFGNTDGTFDQIKKIYNFICVHPDRNEWLKICKENWQNEIDNTAVMRYFKDMIHNRCEYLEAELQNTLCEVKSYYGNGEKITLILEKTADIVKAVKNAETYRELYALNAVKFPVKYSVNKNDKCEISDKADKIFYSSKEIISNILKRCKYPYEYVSEIHKKTSVDALRLLELCEATIERYEKTKKKLSKIDFSDLSEYTIRLLNDPDIAAEISKRYDYICIDEYQDTNYAQEYIFNKISDGKNLFMVGDSKQSIYRFRLAEPKIMLDKMAEYEEYNNGVTSHLDFNYRSDKGIVEFVNKIFNIIMTEYCGGLNYRVTDKLLYGADYIESQELPAAHIELFIDSKGEDEILHCIDSGNPYSVRNDCSKTTESSTAVREGKYIADYIKSIVGIKQIYDITEKKCRKIRYGDCAIIARARTRRVKEILRTIQDSGVPIDIAPLSKFENIFEVEIIKEYLKIIDNDMQDYALLSILSGYWVNMSYSELAEIRNKRPQDEYFYESCLAMRNENKKLEKFYAELITLRFKASYMSLQELLSYIVYNKGYDKHLMTLDDGINKLKAVEQFLSDVNSMGDIKLSEYVRNMTAEELSVNSDEVGDCVITTTAHKSKGLEFPIVFLCDIGDSINKSKGMRVSRLECNKEIGIAVNYFDEETKTAKDNFVFDILKDKNSDEEREQAMRLLYVSLTRAKNHIILTGAADKDEIKWKSPFSVNSFCDWIMNSAVEDASIRNIINFNDDNTLISNETVRYTFKEREEIEYPIIDRYLKYRYPYKKSCETSIKYTVTEINHREVYEDVFKIKYNVESEDDFDSEINKTARGTNYHSILENIDYSCKDEAAVLIELKRMVDEGILTETELSVIDSKEILNVLRSDIIRYADSNTHYREREFMLCVPACSIMDTDVTDNILVQGAIDLIIDGEKLVVVDFKKSNASDEELLRRYSTQMAIYAKAVEEALGKKVDYKVLHIIGRNKTLLV